MKSLVLAAMVILTVFPVVVMAADFADLAEYRVVGDTSVSLAEVLDLFVPSLSGGAKFLSPKVNGLGLIHQWNPQLAGATWKTPLQQGEIIRLPREWVLRGVQGILEPSQATPRVEWNPERVSGGISWLFAAIIGVCAGLIYFYVFVAYFRRRPCQPWRRI